MCPSGEASAVHWTAPWELCVLSVLLTCRHRLRRGQCSGWGPPWSSEGSKCPTMVGTGALKDGGEVVGMGDFLGARDLERSLKSCSGGAETRAFITCATSSPANCWNVAKFESLKAKGLELWDQVHHLTGKPLRAEAGIPEPFVEKGLVNFAE